MTGYIAFDLRTGSFILKQNDFSSRSPGQGDGLLPVFAQNCQNDILLGAQTGQGFRGHAYCIGDRTQQGRLGPNDFISLNDAAQIVNALAACEAAGPVGTPLADVRGLRMVLDVKNQGVRFTTVLANDLKAHEVILTPQTLAQAARGSSKTSHAEDTSYPSFSHQIESPSGLVPG